MAIHVQGPRGQHQITVKQLRALQVRGQLTPGLMIWFEGLAGWMRAEDHPEIGAPASSGLPGAPPASVGVAGSSSPPPGSVPRPAGPASADDQQDAVFVGLIKQSWSYFRAHEFAAHIDEVFLGAVITSALDNGYSLIDLESDGMFHHLRLENLQDGSRLVFQLRHLTSGLLASKVLGHMASVIVGYGERSADFGRLWQSLKAEYKSGYLQNPEPGTITVDGDVNSGYIYVQVDMYWNIQEYVAEDYSINYARLTSHLGACIHALRKYLRGRFIR